MSVGSPDLCYGIDSADAQTFDLAWATGVAAAGGGGANHAILDGSVHTDSIAVAVARGSMIYGNATPKWARLTKGTAGQVLGSDGTDIAWTNRLLPMPKLISTFPVSSGAVFANVHVCAGANFKRFVGIGVVANLSGTVVVEYVWLMPRVIPAGTFMCAIRAICAAENDGTLKFRPKWRMVAGGEDPSAGALNSEEQLTCGAWETGEDDQIKGVFINMDQDTVVAGEILVMQLEITDGTTAPDDVATILAPELYWT